MVKLITCPCGHLDLTREQLQDYWLDEHGPFFM
jgi:hypothetical protein